MGGAGPDRTPRRARRPGRPRCSRGRRRSPAPHLRAPPARLRPCSPHRARPPAGAGPRLPSGGLLRGGAAPWSRCRNAAGRATWWNATYPQDPRRPPGRAARRGVVGRRSLLVVGMLAREVVNRQPGGGGPHHPSTWHCMTSLGIGALIKACIRDLVEARCVARVAARPSPAEARPGPARPGPARPGPARPGPARPGPAPARPGPARPGPGCMLPF